MFDNLAINNERINNEHINNKRHMYNENMDYYDINEHIDQGKEFKKYGKKYYSDYEHKLLEYSSSPEWGSIVEAMTSMDSVNQPNEAAPRQMSPDEAKLAVDNANFNAQLSSYSTLHNTYTSTMFQNEPTDTSRIAMESDLTTQKAALLDAANQVSLDINNNTASNTTIRSAIADKQSSLKAYITNQQAEATKNKMDDVTITGQIENTSLNMTSVYYHYLVYFLIGATLFGFTFYMLVNPNANATNASYVVGALLVVYFISRHYAFQ